MRCGFASLLLLLLLVAGASTGCGSLPGPAPLAEHAAIRVLSDRAPVAARIAVAPPTIKLGGNVQHGGHYEWPAAVVQAMAVESLTTASIAASIRPLPLSAQGHAAGLAAAWAGGDDLLLEIEVTRCEARYIGTTGWYVPNLILWIEFVFPAWFVRDERYAVDIAARATLTAVATGREVWSGQLRGGYEAPLDDFERGVILFGSLRVPGALDGANFAAIGEQLHPHAAVAWQRDLAVRIDGAFRTLAGTPAYARATRRTLGVLIGCGTYYDPALMNLKFPSADVKAMEQWMRRAGADDRQLLLLTDERATRTAVLAGVREFLAKRARAGDRVVIHFSGYAAPDGEGGVVLLPYDADPKRPGATGIGLDEIAAAVAEIPGAEVLVLLDTGLGDGAGTRWADCGLAAPDATQVRDAIARIGARANTTVLAACEPGEGAAEVGEQRRGLLTLSWLLAVADARDRNSDGRISVDEAFRDVRRAVQMHALLSGRTQNPQLVTGANGGVEIPGSDARGAE